MENMNPNSKNTHGEAVMNTQLLQSKQQKLTVMTKNKTFRSFPPENDVVPTWWEVE